MKYLKGYSGEVVEKEEFVTEYTWKHWTFEVRRGAKEKSFTIKCDKPFEEYLKSLTGFRKLEKAEKTIDIAIMHFVRHVKAKEPVVA